MYIEYSIKSEADVILNAAGTGPEPGANLAGQLRKKGMLSNRCKAIFSDIINILTVQDFSGASIDTLGNMCDLEKSLFVQDHGTFKSFFQPLISNGGEGGAYRDYTNAADSVAYQDAQPFQSVSGDDGNFFQANGAYAACGVYLQFNAAATSEAPEVPRFLYVCLRAGVTGSGRPEYLLYMCACNDDTEFSSANLLGAFGLTKTIYPYKGISQAMPLSFNPINSGTTIFELSSYQLIFSMSSPLDGGGHVLVMPKMIVPGSTPDDGSLTLTSYNMYGSSFFMTRYDPIDYWYDTTNWRVSPMTPWAVMSIHPGGSNNSGVIGGQSLNIFNTSTQLIIESTTSAKDLCLLKFVGSSAMLSIPVGYKFFTNKISDRVKAEAINLIGINVSPISPLVVMMGKVSSVSGIYFVGGQNLAYGDVISAVNANNTFVNYIVLPTESVAPMSAPRAVDDHDNKLKLAVPLV